MRAPLSGNPQERSEGRSLAWPGSAKRIPETEILAVVNELESRDRNRLRQLAEALRTDEVSTLMWLIEGSFRPSLTPAVS